MSPNPGPRAAAVRPAAVVNEDIRALWHDARVGLTDDQRAVYERLLAEWAAAVRADVVPAA
ncbi:hypothetical protein [Streptomyces longispororuber]|nr:hypothetical protein [Streptomyces longispororuber]